MDLHGVSLFSNCGAGDRGFSDAGFTFEVLAELRENRLEVALLNHPHAKGIPGDLRETWSEVVAAWNRRFPTRKPDLLAACPPCQGMSSARGNRGLETDPDAGSRDERNLLVLPIAHVASVLQPRVIVIENVPAFLRRKVRHPNTGEAISAASLLISILKEEYALYPFLTDLADYGVPQTRRRAFLTFIRREEPSVQVLSSQGAVPYPRPSHDSRLGGRGPISLASALRGFSLPSLDARAGAERDPERPLHQVPVWSRRQYAMVAAIPPNSGASAWQNCSCEFCGEVEAKEDDATCPRCGAPLLRPVVKVGTSHRLVKGFRRSSYRRMDPNAPAATITTASGRVGSDRTIHPWENRVLSPLECALLQTIPDDFRWGDVLEKVGITELRAMIGEAVPPLFTRLHGELLAGLLLGSDDMPLLSEDDPRCRRAWQQLGLAPIMH